MSVPHARWAGRRDEDWVRVADTASEHSQLSGRSAEVWIRRPVPPTQPHYVVWLRAFPSSTGVICTNVAATEKTTTITSDNPITVYLAGDGRLVERRVRVHVVVEHTGDGAVTVWLGPPDQAATPSIRGRLSERKRTRLLSFV
jgi:hypothetical protein